MDRRRHALRDLGLVLCLVIAGQGCYLSHHPPEGEEENNRGSEGPDRSCERPEAEGITVEAEEEMEIETVVETSVAIYLMLDRSASMDGQLYLDGLYCPESILNPACSTPCYSGFEPWCCSSVCGVAPSDQMTATSKWDVAVGAVAAFVNDRASAGLNIALQYFPNAGQCDGAGYDTPAVALGALPDLAMPITTSLQSTAPETPATGTNTPTEGALLGATRFCAMQQRQQPDQRCVVVLVTDGVPAGECDNTSQRMQAIASDALDNDGVMTFAVGMQGADFTQLNMISDAGGSDCDPESVATACNASEGPDALLAALNNVRTSVTRVETAVETSTEATSETLPCR